MSKKTDFNDLIKKYQPAVRNTGKQLARALKTAEEDIAKMYKVAQTHVEIQMKNLQKEKIYHDLGKYVAAKILDESIDLPGLEKYKKELIKINTENEKKKKALSRAGKMRKMKRNAAKNKK